MSDMTPAQVEDSPFQLASGSILVHPVPHRIGLSKQAIGIRAIGIQATKSNKPIFDNEAS